MCSWTLNITLLMNSCIVYSAQPRAKRCWRKDSMTYTYVAGQGILLLSMTPVPLVVERRGAPRSSPATSLGQVNAYAAAQEPHMKCQNQGHILSCTRGSISCLVTRSDPWSPWPVDLDTQQLHASERSQQYRKSVQEKHTVSAEVMKGPGHSSTAALQNVWCPSQSWSGNVCNRFNGAAEAASKAATILARMTERD